MVSRVAAGIFVVAAAATLLAGCGEKQKPGNDMGPTGAPTVITGDS
ncbi:MAG: hypothetical protein NVV57_05245 [Demequina sp.]|nr:hypothetical protein [Demequina sp.]